MIVYIPFVFMVSSLLSLSGCLIYFGLSRRVSLKNPMIAFRFFDFCFFNKSKLANFSIFMFFTMYVFGIWDYFLRHEYTIHVLAYFIGTIAIFLFIVHCRFLSRRKFSCGNKIECIREFFF